MTNYPTDNLLKLTKYPSDNLLKSPNYPPDNLSGNLIEDKTRKFKKTGIQDNIEVVI